MKNSPQTLRNFTRLPINIVIEYEYKGNHIQDFSNNLSVGGLFINTIHVLEIGAVINLKLTLPHNHVTISTKAEVAWCNTLKDEDNEIGVGVQFVELSLEDENTLNDTIKYLNAINKELS